MRMMLEEPTALFDFRDYNGGDSANWRKVEIRKVHVADKPQAA